MEMQLLHGLKINTMYLIYQVVQRYYNFLMRRIFTMPFMITHQIPLFTKLLFQKKITQSNYNTIKADFDEQYRIRQEEEKKQRDLDKTQGIQKGGSTPKPMNSPLLISTIQTAFYEGVINEYDVCKTLNISPDKLDKYL